MGEVSLEIFKQHVRCDDTTEEDGLLEYYLRAAERMVETATGRSVAELKAMEGGEYPTPLAQAAIMLAGHWYNQRESVSGVQMHSVPQSFDFLVKPYRKLTEDTEENEDSDDSREDEE